MFESAEAFNQALSLKVNDPNKNEENGAQLAVAEKVIQEQPIQQTNSLVIGGSIEFRLIRKADNSIELSGLLLISQDDRLVDKITIPPLLIINDPEHENISVKF